MTPSSEQLNFRDALTSSSDNLLLSAVAGSGKTTTIIWAADALSRSLSVHFLAFNKKIDDALGTRLHPRFSHSTFHVIGKRTLERELGQKWLKVDGDKVRKLLAKVAVPRAAWPAVCRLVSYAKNVGLGTTLLPESPDEWSTLMDHHGMSVPDGFNTEWASAALAASNAQRSVVDFDDMLYLPLFLNVPWHKIQVVFVDEAQDTNTVQMELLSRFAKRVVAVGDPHQAIYGFRGADANALTVLADRFSMTELPLSVSYRCSQAVVAEAQRVLTA